LNHRRERLAACAGAALTPIRCLHDSVFDKGAVVRASNLRKF